MKYIYYDIKNTVNLGTENDPHIEDIIRTVRIRYSENNLIFAQEESYNGEYRIEDDGIEEVIANAFSGNLQTNKNLVKVYK